MFGFSQILLKWQIPTGKDPYVIIHFDEQDLRASTLIEDDSGSYPTPMDEDVLQLNWIQLVVRTIHLRVTTQAPTPFVHQSPEMEIQASLVVQPKVMRKRKKFFDEYMKNLLNDTSNICRARKDCPSSLAIGKQNNTLQLRKDDVIYEPFPL
ncbi:hypothetical protein CASFOL_033270 [Castilleja foliolosa]|uniref:Uncharacterized protein n=1 Tax=Castilleja foliolosa TaxID=1961234 RepID=A0ABD3BZH2_9LAMI